MNNLTVGMKVEIRLPEGHPLYTTQWWPKAGKKVTGTVQKLFKNGKVAVAVDQLYNKSEDHKHTINFSTVEALIPFGS